MSAALLKSGHPGELSLRRLHAGEDVGTEVAEHAGQCAQCKERLKAFADEQRRFEAELPFDRFAAGVERAARTPRASTPGRGPWLQAFFALAATVLLAVGFGQFFSIGGSTGRNGLKGGGVDIVVAPPGHGAQRPASMDPLVPEQLARGERVRIGFSPGTWRYLAVLSIDASGQVTPLYPEAGASLAITPGAPRAWLPDSIEFTGSGLERVVVVMGPEPLELAALGKEMKRRFDEAQSDVAKMAPLDITGEQFHRTFLKP